MSMARQLRSNMTSLRSRKTKSQGWLTRQDKNTNLLKIHAYWMTAHNGSKDLSIGQMSLKLSVRGSAGMKVKTWELISMRRNGKNDRQKDLLLQFIESWNFYVAKINCGEVGEYEADAHWCTANGLVWQYCGSCHSKFQLLHIGCEHTRAHKQTHSICLMWLSGVQ